jgi:hypothetical protein
VFSYYHNFHHPTEFFINGKKHTNDYNTDLYNPYIRAFLAKRWMAKREIPPKISIMADMGPDFKQTYYQQRLPFNEFQYSEKHLERLYEAENLNTQFLHSMYFEDYEKNMYEAAMQKKVMNGSVVPLLEKPKHDKIQAKLENLFHIFYQGEKLTALELDIER